MPPPKRGQASFAKKKVEVDPEEERRKKAEYDAAQKKKRLEAAKRFSVGGTVDLDLEGRARFDLTEADVTADGTLRNVAIGQAEVDRLLELPPGVFPYLP